MVIMSADVTKEIKQMTEKLVQRGIYKSQSEVVRDAIRQLAYKYGVETSLQEVRSVTKRGIKASKESLSKAVHKMREEV